MKRELETILERDVLPVTIPEFPTVRRLTMMVSSIHAREAMEQQQKAFTQRWDPSFIGYSAAVYFLRNQDTIMENSIQEKAGFNASQV